MSLGIIYGEVYVALARAITGALLTEEQIQQVSRHAVGRYFSELLLEDRKSAKVKIERAYENLQSASVIISEIQSELEARRSALDLLLKEIEEKRNLADRYSHLAATNKEASAAIRAELEDTLKTELTARSRQGRGLRITVNSGIWLFTLLVGAGLGTYFKDIVDWLSRHFTSV
ncbi:hypothetical protein RHIZ_07080 [Rhizobium skierniewicense]|uniref:hypothetical protein n=1 Tax=Rhizobium skierniewicense TaxID=984260 RepID=UPI001FAE4B49|nr:hypothetical protein [Rhizobium skierniewicense]MCI9865704.1 hypothetical protein [Rhizobium skierniewicense]